MAEAKAESLGPCQWCGDEGVTHIIVVPGRKNKKLAVVCEVHATRFERAGQMTTRLEVERKLEADVKRSKWKGRQQWH